MIYFDLFVGVLTAPYATLRTLAAQPRPGAAAVVHALIILITALARIYTAPQAVPLPTAAILGLAVLFGTLGLFLYAAVLHFSAECLGGEGRALGLLTALAFASAPGVLLFPFGLAMRAAPPVFYDLVGVVIGLWVLVLHILSLMTAYGFSFWRALAALILPVAFVLAALVLGVVLGAAALLSHLKVPSFLTFLKEPEHTLARRFFGYLLILVLLAGEVFLIRPAVAQSPASAQPVTRGDFARYLAAALELPPAPSGAQPFPDITDEATRQAAARVHRAGFMSGFLGGTFRPYSPVTRAQAVAVLLRAAGELPDAPARSLSPLADRQSVPLPFADVPPSHWAREAIACAWQKGLVAGVGGGRFLPDRPVGARELAELFQRFLGPEAYRRSGLEQAAMPSPQAKPATRAEAIPILLYHHLAPAGTGWDDNGATITPEEFAWQMDYLAARGYKVLSAEELRAFLLGEKDFPHPAVAITFDDGYASNLHYAFPILKRHQFPAIINVITGFRSAEPQLPYDVRRLQHLSWPELREMVSSGLITVGSHTDNLHSYVPSGPQGIKRPALVARLYDPATGRVETETAYRARVLADLTASRQKIARELGTYPSIFAYPFGVSDPLSRELVARAGFTLTFGTRPALARRGSGLSDVPRLVVRSGLTEAEFSALLAGKMKPRT
ncbi:MAG: poly-beta,6-N-acetyl-D-glucosamine N-deacetylase [Bacillota bacterium]|jgi:peptidoglycan/xylan/chitin deacetylase (PgdA/CDA1 family)|nr:poly-beta,6-N-acetyl-D-glucosamine N-deacetylase [Bacillota bacterium]MDK2883280.1 poly-beta,6-N-acetyl-D-glucosamine N-deacetylase [Bacillota bacterium]